MLEEIIKCTEEGDTESFMDLFSDYSRNSQPELEEQIREMMDFYEGKWKAIKEMPALMRKVNTEALSIVN